MYGYDTIRPLPLRSISYDYDTPIFLQDHKGEYLAYQGFQTGRPVVKIEAEGPRRVGDILVVEVAKDGLAEECQSWDEYSMRAEIMGFSKNAMMSEEMFHTYKTLRYILKNTNMGRNV